MSLRGVSCRSNLLNLSLFQKIACLEAESVAKRKFSMTQPSRLTHRWWYHNLEGCLATSATRSADRLRLRLMIVNSFLECTHEYKLISKLFFDEITF